MSRRLLQAMAGAPHGGAETFFVRLADALERAGETQRVVIRRDPDRVQRLRAVGVDVIEFGFGGRFDVATGWRFRKLVADWRPDLVLTWMSRATQACPRGDFVHVARLGGYYDLKYYRGCDHLIANTPAIANYAVAGGWPPDRIDYVPNFVPDLRRSDDAAPCRDRPQALALARLHPNKGLSLLIEAMVLSPDLRLTIAGDGPLRAALQRQVYDLNLSDRVTFLGWREDVSVLLAQADFLVCPSLHEPLGNVVIEAWSAGVPVVATMSDGPARLITHEVDGLLVALPGQPGGGVPALAAAMTRLSRDPQLRQRLAQAGRRAYEAEFTETAVVARYRRLFDRLAPA